MAGDSGNVIESGRHSSDAQELKRLNLRLPMDMFKRIEYWSQRHGLSMNDYLIEAIDHAIKYENMDYELPHFEAIRAQQDRDMLVAMSHKMDHIESMVSASNEHLMLLMSGGNYVNY